MKSLFPSLKFVLPLLALPTAHAASYVTPDYYVYTPGQGSYQGAGTTFGDYLYEGGSGQLTDGRIGQDNWTLDGPPGVSFGDPAYTPGFTWVGWHTVEPSLTFYFSGAIDITRIEIGFNRDQAANIHLPSGLQVTEHNGGTDRQSSYQVGSYADRATVTGPGHSYTSYGLGGNSYYTDNGITYGVGQRDWLVFEGPFVGNSITISLSHLPNGWTLPTTQAGWEATHWVFIDEVRFLVPDAGTSRSLLLLGLLGLVGYLRRAGGLASATR